MAQNSVNANTNKKKLFDIKRVITGGKVYEIAKDELKKLGTNGVVDLAYDYVKGNDDGVKLLATNIGNRAVDEIKVNIKKEPVYPYAIIGGVAICGFAVYGFVVAVNKVVTKKRGKNAK